MERKKQLLYQPNENEQLTSKSTTFYVVDLESQKSNYVCGDYIIKLYN